MNVFHYAPWAKLPAIVQSGCLRPSNAAAADELPLLWFSAHQRWEPTATKMMQTERGLVLLTMDEQVERFGCIRFGLISTDPRLLPWVTACKAAGMGDMTRRKLERVGVKRGGTPGNWFAIADSVTLSGLTFDVYGAGGWHAADPAEMAQVWTEQRGG